MTCCWSYGGGITCYESHPTLSNLRVIGNIGEGILLTNSNPKLTNVTITGNMGTGIGIGDFSKPEFDSVNRCNIYSNYAIGGHGSDLSSSNDTLNIKVVVDTFTVICPTDVHAYPKKNFTFDIMNAK